MRLKARSSICLAYVQVNVEAKQNADIPGLELGHRDEVNVQVIKRKNPLELTKGFLMKIFVYIIYF